MTGKVVHLGEWKRMKHPPKCGSELAHEGCRFAKPEMDCGASPRLYDMCPYRQRGDTVIIVENLA